MLGDSITITLGGAGGTAKILKKINNEGFASQYLLREAAVEYAMKVAHSKNGTRDRHYVEIKETTFGATADDLDTVVTVSGVILAAADEVSADVTDLQEALSYFMDGTNTPLLLGWES